MSLGAGIPYTNDNSPSTAPPHASPATCRLRYPSSSSSSSSPSPLCSAKFGYDRSTERADSFILPTLQKAFGEELTHYEIIGDKIIQPNAVGMKLCLTPTQQQQQGVTDDESLKKPKKWPDEVFFKQVLATDYVSSRKDWSDLRRTLLYARTELRFYRDILPIMNQKGFHATPKVYYSHYDFGGWIDEDEHATQPSDESINKEKLPDPLVKGGWLILECVPENTYMQDSPLSVDRAWQCLEAAADLHASAWQDEALLQRASAELSRAAFNLQMRNPKELVGITESWEEFCFNFRGELEAEGLWTERVRNLGSRIKDVAERISEELSPSPTDDYATCIHGDYKAMNVMMGINPEITSAVMIDMATASTGLGMCDVAMHVHHAVEPHDLDGGGEEHLVECYLDALRDRGCEYPRDVAWRHYKLAVVDYARFFMGRMWKAATPETMEQKRDNRNVANINRSIPSAMRFVKVVEKYLTEIEDSL
mmetsp:Transcript_40310/g.87007  ORF Transcript_40310/g.87007 Transcript_40310/m.87007 type:complete len:480 (+) Transcript_40310:1343-2782(+)